MCMLCVCVCVCQCASTYFALACAPLYVARPRAREERRKTKRKGNALLFFFSQFFLYSSSFFSSSSFLKVVWVIFFLSGVNILILAIDFQRQAHTHTRSFGACPCLDAAPFFFFILLALPRPPPHLAWSPFLPTRHSSARRIEESKRRRRGRGEGEGGGYEK